MALTFFDYKLGISQGRMKSADGEDYVFVLGNAERGDYGWFKEGDNLTEINKGDVIFVPAGDFHGTIAGEEGMVVIACQGPPDVKLMKGERNTDQK